MIYDGKCPKQGCGGKLAEARGDRTRNGLFEISPHGWYIKTKCTRCGAFIGYRPAKAVETKHGPKRQRAKRTAAGSGEAQASLAMD